MTTQIGGTTGITFPDASTQNTAATGFGFKNRIINGAMMIDQRNAGAAITVNSGSAGGYIVDRFRTGTTGSWGSAVFSAGQNKNSVTLPAGYSNYLGFATTTADAAPSSGTTYELVQWIEGFNIADLSWGGVNAKSVTLSFQVYTNLTGTFGGALQNASANRCYPFSFTVSSANTWTQVSVTIAGDTTGTWATNNTGGIRVAFSLGCGSTYLGTAGSWGATLYSGVTGQQQVCASTSNVFYITGVQLEKGSTATSFDYRPYGTELALCQRYYVKATNQPLQVASGGYGYFGGIQFPTTMRSGPTTSNVSYSSSNGGATGPVTVYETSPEGFSHYNSSNNCSVNYMYAISYSASSEL